MNLAKAIKQIRKEVPNPVEEQNQAVSEIVKAIADNKEAILTTINILKELQEVGVLKAANAMLVERTDVAEIALQQLNQPAVYNMIKNGMAAVSFLGSVKPAQLQTMMDAVSLGLERFSESAGKGEKPSLFKLGTSMRNPEIRTSLSSMMGFLQGMGEAFEQQNQQNLH
jgi:uncharacterized protein YjgD (DUF1641 family)